MSNFLKRSKEIRFYTFIVFTFFLKVFLLPFGSHPFDFWTFLTTIEKSIYYNWNIFEAWNKGNLLIMAWYSSYSFYHSFTSFFGLNEISVLLIQFFMKSPYLLVDVISGLLIYKIVKYTANNEGLARSSLLLWLLNPVVFYVYVLHGHYELIVVFGLLLIIYGIVLKKDVAVSLGLIISLQTKYYFVIFVPFLVLYYVVAKRYKGLIRVVLISTFGMFLSYIQFVKSPRLIKQTVESVLYLSHSTSPVGVDEIFLSRFNIFSIINTVVFRLSPISNLNNPEVFSLANMWVLFMGCFLVIFFIYRVLRTILERRYCYKVLIKDILIILTASLLFFTNFQNHYFIWFIPLFIIVYSFKASSTLKTTFVLINIVAINISIRGEYGLLYFFSNTVDGLHISSISSQSVGVLYWEGALLVLSTILFTIMAFLKARVSGIQQTINTLFDMIYVLPMVMISVYFISLSLSFTHNMRNLNYEGEYSPIKYSNGDLHKGVIWGNYEVREIDSNGNIVFYDSDKYNQMIIEELVENPGLKDYFEGHVIFKGEMRIDDRQGIENALVFNDCEITRELVWIKNFEDRIEYQGIEVPLECLQIQNNTVFFINERSSYNYDIELYIRNTPISYLSDNNQSKLLVFSCTYIVIILGLISAIICIIKSINKQDAL